MSKQTDEALKQVSTPLQTMPGIYDTKYYAVALQYLDRAGITDKLSKQDKETFLMMCARNKLDPTLGEIYPILRSGKLTIVTNYLIYYRRANETGLVDGMDDTEFGGVIEYKEIEKEYAIWDNGKKVGTEKRTVTVVDRAKSDLWCRVRLYRKDSKYPYSTKIWLREFAPEEPGIWVEKTCYMLEKCAHAINYRRAFQGVHTIESLPFMEEEVAADPGKGNRNPIIIEAEIDHPTTASPLEKSRDECKSGLQALADLVYDNYNVPTRQEESQKNHLKGQTIDDCNDISLLKAYTVYLRCRWYQSMIEKRGDDLGYEKNAPIYDNVKDMVAKREVNSLRELYNNIKEQ